MSLQVWLPLTKDTRNQGLITLPSPWEAWTRDNNGKLGQYCYSDCAIYHMADEWLNNEWSLACWVKSSGWSQYNDILLCKNVSESTRSQFYFSIINGATLNLGTNGGSGGVSYSYTFATNTWYHVAATYNGSIACLYINGIQVKSQSYATTKLNNMNNFCVGCRSTNSAGTSGTGNTGVKRLNDVRVYNHCLSPMEVKELAKGLILHYPLNRQGWGQENLFTEKYWSYGNGWNTKNLINSSTSTIKPIVNSDGSCTLTGGDAANSQCYCSNYGNMVTLEPNTTYTISVKITANGPCNFRMWWYDYDSNGTKLTTVSTPSEMIPSGTTKLFTFTRTTVANTAKCYWELNLYGTASTSTCVMHAKSLKLEKGSIATPWCPNSSDALATTMGLNSTTEYDCSGFCNNGTRTGTFTWNSDTPKYAVSTQYNGTDNTLKIPFDASVWPDNFTMSIWFRKDELGSKNYETLFGGPSGFEMDTRSGSSSSLSIYMASTRGGNVYTGIEFGKWYMVTLVNDGTNELYYINGELVKTIAKKSMPVGNYWIGSWSSATSQNYKGLISDARVYATALSASDVKSLYQNCATIDPDGTIRGQIRS